MVQWPPALVITSARPPVMITAAVPAGPKDAEVTAAPPSASGGDNDQWRPLSADQAASRLPAWLVPTSSRATVWFGVWVSRSTVMGWRASAAGICGPAACHVPPLSAKMPAVPGLEHAAAISGRAGCVYVTAVTALQSAGSACSSGGEGPPVASVLQVV